MRRIAPRRLRRRPGRRVSWIGRRPGRQPRRYHDRRARTECREAGQRVADALARERLKGRERLEGAGT
jgi:hypothetical protein